jgi:hypothetical protein
VRIDHVIFGVADLDAAAERFADRYGLAAQAGGEHPQLGTRNCLVPVGAGQYVELMAVADPHSGHPLPRFVVERIAGGDRPVAVCVAPDDLDAVAGRLSLEIVDGERHTPAGAVVRWRMAGLEAALGPDRLPFFIDWRGGGPGLDPALNRDCAGIAWVELGGDAARFRLWVGDDGLLPVRFEESEPGPMAVAVRRGDDVVVLR